MQLTIAPAASFADAAVSAMRAALQGADRPRVGLPTGRTMIPFYARLREEGLTLPAGARAWAIDEYCWPDAGHPGTNAAFFRTHWPEVSVAVPRADAADPDAEIARHCRSIDEAGGLGLVILGIGENGHIAFNEPGSAADAPCRALALTERTREQIVTDWPEPPTRGMTLGMCELLAARQIILLASGAGKRDILTAALRGEPSPAIPASLLGRHPNLTVVCDAEAGALLASGD